MSRPYLEGYEIERANMCVAEIEDKLKAIKIELQTRERPYKYYLMEKLKHILNDVECMLAMSDEKGDDEDGNQI